MFNILLLSISILLFILLVGYPIATLLFFGHKKETLIDRYLILSFSLIIGFGVSAFASSTAYSFFGIRSYILIMLSTLIISWFIYFKFRIKLKTQKIRKTSNLYLLFFTCISLYFVKSQWDGSLKSIIFSGAGPDVPQNLMASLKADELGQTWFEASERVISDLDASSIDDAAFRMFEIPSHSSLAVVDYLVFGVRWGLHIPFSIIVKILGPQSIMYEIGTVLVVTLISVTILTFAMTQLLTKSNKISSGVAVAVALNASFLNQYFNGGVSQAFGLIGNIGLLMVIVLLLQTEINFDTRKQKIGLFVLSTSSYLASSIAYVDGTFGAVLFITVFIIFLLLILRNSLKKFMFYLILPGFASLALTPLFTFLVFDNLSSRTNAASGTGVSTGIWKLPSQFLGLLTPYTSAFESRNSMTFLLSFVVSIAILVVAFLGMFSKDKLKRLFSLLVLAGLVVNLIGLIFGINSRNKSDYIYNKISTYAAPYLIFSLLMLLFYFSQSKKLKSVSNIFIFSICSVILVNSIYIENKFSTSNDIIIKIPNNYANLLKDKNLYNYLNSNNYILPYKPAYSFTGLFGVNFWISKAPNDMDLQSRISNPLRLLCFKGDNVCSPKTLPIKNAALESYGILEFESELTTLEFSQLSILDRYNYATDSFNQPRITIPEKFLGGNPYFK